MFKNLPTFQSGLVMLIYDVRSNNSWMHNIPSDGRPTGQYACDSQKLMRFLCEVKNHR